MFNVWHVCLRQSVTSLATVPEAPTPTIAAAVDIETVGAQSLAPPEGRRDNRHKQSRPCRVFKSVSSNLEIWLLSIASAVIIHAAETSLPQRIIIHHHAHENRVI